MNTDETLDPVSLAREAEDLGVESVFLPDHSHVPVQRGTAYDGPRALFPNSPNDLPRDYYRNLDQLITLAAMAAATSRIALGTGVCLVVQRDPIVLAKEIASLDVIADGRVLFSVGAGAPWNADEMRNHGTDPASRYVLFAERIAVMKQIWCADEAEFHGQLVDLDPIFSWPKPVQRPHPPILVGGWGPTVLDRVLAVGDGSIAGHHDRPGEVQDFARFPDRVQELRARAAELGRTVEVTVNLARRSHVQAYVDLGADRPYFRCRPDRSPRCEHASSR